MFLQTRDQSKTERANVVVDLSPEGYQLRRLKDLILRWLAQGSKEHLLTAFWEYVLLLEICGKILEKDREVHKRNHKLFEPYQRLLAHFRAETAMEGLNFSARLLMLIERIADRYQEKFGTSEGIDLKNEQLTELLHQTTLHDLRAEVVAYAKSKGEVLVLFDNIDKGWNASGLESTDVVMIRTLLDASRKLGNDFRRAGVDFHCTIFLRNDVHDMLVSHTADRGKEATVLVDWVQPALLKQMVRQRLIFNSTEKTASIEELWYNIAEPLMAGEDSLSFLIDRSLMRPRYLLRLINYCKGNATNFGRDRIDEDDFTEGLSLYSTDVVTEIGLEIRDVLPVAGDILYALLGEPRYLTRSALITLLSSKIPDIEEQEAAFALLLWHGVVGFNRGDDDAVYIFNVNYDLKRLLGLLEKHPSKNPPLILNPAFVPGLELTG